MSIAYLLNGHTHGCIRLTAQNAGRRIVSKNDLSRGNASYASGRKLMLVTEVFNLLGVTNQKYLQIGYLPETVGYRRDNATGTEVPAHHINR
tara:strand:+ start:2664 stop:2939 length:276 start_codon:yes stop_codon:yes gene_type:complete